MYESHANMKKLTVGRLNVGKPCISADILYSTAFKAPDSVVFLQVRGQRYLVVSAMEIGRARDTALALHALSPEDLGLSRKRRRDLAEWAYALLKSTGVRRVEVPAVFPLGIARRLEKRGVIVKVAPGPFCPQRETKTREEIGKIKAVQEAAVRAMEAAFQLLGAARIDSKGFLRHEGRILASEAVRQHINLLLLRENCSGGEPIVACGDESADPHAIGHGPIRAGEPVVIDIFPQHLETGYWGDITRTVVKGPPRRPEVWRMFRAVKAAHHASLRALRAGVTGASIHKVAARELERRGFRNGTRNGAAQGFIHGTGHGVGLEIHETPTLSPAGPRLRAGNVVTVEPGLYYGGIGGVRIEDTVVVTRSGYEVLAKCPYPMVI